MACCRAGDSSAVAEPASGQVKVSLKASPVTYEDIRSVSMSMVWSLCGVMWESDHSLCYHIVFLNYHLMSLASTLKLRGLSAHRTHTGVAGTYGVGTVSSVGAGVLGVPSSAQVLVASSHGTWTTDALLSAQEVFAIDSIDVAQAACLPEAASAWALLHNFASLNSGDVVLRSAEPSTVNTAIDQIAKALGILVIPASDADLVDTKFKEKLASQGHVKLALSSGTGRAARAMLALTGKAGVLVTYNGAVPPLNDSLSGIEVPSLSLIFQDQAVNGFDFKAWVSNSPVEASLAISESVKLIKSGQLKFSPVVFKAAKFADALDAAGGGKNVVIEL